MILAIDPGKMNGWAIFDEDGELVEFGQVHEDGLFDWLKTKTQNLSTIVIEDYILYKKKAMKQSGSDMVASRVIGRVEMFASLVGAKLVKQKADILPTAQKLSGYKMPSDHSISHQFSAINHGIYWLIKQGRRKNALERGDVTL